MDRNKLTKVTFTCQMCGRPIEVYKDDSRQIPFRFTEEITRVCLRCLEESLRGVSSDSTPSFDGEILH